MWRVVWFGVVVLCLSVLAGCVRSTQTIDGAFAERVDILATQAAFAGTGAIEITAVESAVLMAAIEEVIAESGFRISARFEDPFIVLGVNTRDYTESDRFRSSLLAAVFGGLGASDTDSRDEYVFSIIATPVQRAGDARMLLSGRMEKKTRSIRGGYSGGGVRTFGVDVLREIERRALEAS
jgi:hypothetical protein